MTETSTWAEAGRKFGEMMEKATGGKIHVNVYAARPAYQWKPVRGHPGPDERGSGADIHAFQPNLFRL